jgi:hypothetical protein
VRIEGTDWSDRNGRQKLHQHHLTPALSPAPRRRGRRNARSLAQARHLPRSSHFALLTSHFHPEVA